MLMIIFRSMIKIADFLTYLVLRIVETTLSILPRNIALFIGNVAGLLLYTLKFRKKVVLNNMRHVELCPAEQIEALIRKVYLTTSQYAVDFLRNGKVPISSISGIETAEKILERKQGLIAILAHFGNWELLAQVFGSHFPSLHVIAKKMHNPYANAWVEKKRTAANVETIYREQALRKMLQAIAKNGIVAILIDQRGGAHGSAALFLDKRASTVKTVAGIVLKTNCPVVSIYALMREDSTYEIVIDEVPPPDVTGLDQEAAILVYQNLHNQILSTWIRKYPEHYFGWFHQRFKGMVDYSRP
jgi:KDO2-lipid IV(A) lauroyltransferase